MQRLRLTAARYVLAFAGTPEVVQAADAALDRGLYSDGLAQLVSTPDLVFADAGPLFERALHELGVPLPGWEAAFRTLLLGYLGDIAERAVSPRHGLDRLVKDLFGPVVFGEQLSDPWDDRFRNLQAADLHGLGFFFQDAEEYEDPRNGPQALAALDREVIEQAQEWIRERGGVRIEPAWLTWNGGRVRELATAVREGRHSDTLPVLGDALAEAGCEDADVLAHCREPGHPTTVCWVVDLLLPAGRLPP